MPCKQVSGIEWANGQDESNGAKPGYLQDKWGLFVCINGYVPCHNRGPGTVLAATAAI